MANFYKCSGTPINKCGGNKPSRCAKYSVPCDYNDPCDDCARYEEEMRDALECLMRLEELSAKKLAKAREYQEEAEMLMAKALDAQCKGNELLEEVECIEKDAYDIRANLYSLIHKTVECYKNECCGNGCCKCKCACNCGKKY